VVWTLAQQGYALIYKMPEKDYLKAFQFDLTQLQVTATPFLTATIRPPDGMPGGFSSLSANGEQGGIVWTLLSAAGDGTSQPVPGRFVAFDATTLNLIWEDDQPALFAKFTSPTIADGKVYRPTYSNVIIVYGLLPAASPVSTPEATAPGGATARAFALMPAERAASRGAMPATTAGGAARSCRTIEQEYLRFGGAKGVLGKPLSSQTDIGDQAGGRYQIFIGESLGGPFSVNPKSGRAAAQTDEDMPPFLPQLDIESSIYWSPTTCAHVVLGEIRKLWLSMGAQQSSLGYPTSDEINTPDERGRRSKFQNGEIWWKPGRGAYVYRGDKQ
jgi:hypothetical protein